MNPEVKAQLIADLRSGEYRQGHGVLRDTKGGYCCLGVLCERARRSGIALRVETFGYSHEDGDNFSALVPPKNVRDWADLDDEIQLTMIRMNDKERRSFGEIADYLEGLE